MSLMQFRVSFGVEWLLYSLTNRSFSIQDFIKDCQADLILTDEDVGSMLYVIGTLLISYVDFWDCAGRAQCV